MKKVIVFLGILLVYTGNAATEDKTQQSKASKDQQIPGLQDVPLDDDPTPVPNPKNYGILKQKPQTGIEDDQGCRKFCIIL